MSLRANKIALGTLSTLKPEKKLTVREVVRDTLTAIIFGIAAIKTPPIWFIVDESSKYLNFSASPLAPDKVAIQKQENLPEEIKTLLWSNDGLQQSEVVQNKGNCQIMANIIASTFTEEGQRKLESMIEVTDYNLDYRNFYINFNVNINGKKIPVSYHDLINESPSLYYNKPQAPYILAYAIEKELRENYLPNPVGFTAQSTSTFLTNKPYTTMLVPVMSDESLIQILKQAPNEIVCVGSYPELNDTERTIIDILKMEKTRIEQSSKSSVTLNHEFAVKNYKYENGKHLITLVAYHNKEITLTMEELRKNILAITAPTKSFNIIDSRAMWTYFVSLMLIIGIRKALGNKKRCQSPGPDTNTPTL